MINLQESPFHWERPEVGKLTTEVWEKCILDKIFPAEPPLNYNWIGPGGGYRGQWLWDTMFVVDLLSLLPDKKNIIRDVFQNFWDFQERWDREMPEFAHGMIANFIQPGNHDWLKFPAYSQIPILAWGVERVFRRNGDMELVRRAVQPLERFHDWYWRERDVTGCGLVSVGVYSEVTRKNTIASGNGWEPVQQARFETFDCECNLDDLQLTRHPARKENGNGKWYGDICLPGNTAYLILAETCLMRLADLTGDHAMATRRRAKADRGAEAVRQLMWDDDSGLFLAVQRDTLKKIPVATIGSWIPLHAGIPTARMAARMAAAFQTPNWQTPLPIPTVDSQNTRYAADGFWRGDVWPATNYQIAEGFARYGYKDIAADIADKTIANAITNGISERYDSRSGKAHGVDFLGMTCTIITMMLDGLSQEHRLWRDGEGIHGHRRTK
jgi:glycogen debranching enzyme